MHDWNGYFYDGDDGVLGGFNNEGQMKYLIFLILTLGLSNPVMAYQSTDTVHIWGSNFDYRGNKVQVQESADREKRSNPGYDVLASSINRNLVIDNGILVNGVPRYEVPAVITSTGGIVSLDDFVKSGKFCEIYGHKWEQVPFVRCICYRCGLCHKERKQSRFGVTDYKWEP